MPLSIKTIQQLFPKNEPAFVSPFHVETDKDGLVHIFDATNNRLTTFCECTQLPINDERAIAAEISYWQDEANRLVNALNMTYPKTI